MMICHYIPPKIVQQALPISTFLVFGNCRISGKRLPDDSTNAVFDKLDADKPVIIRR